MDDHKPRTVPSGMAETSPMFGYLPVGLLMDECLGLSGLQSK